MSSFEESNGLSSSAELEIIKLNVGGRSFATTRHTLNSITDTFFTALLSDRLPTSKDSSDSIFIDRDPEMFAIILNYLRTHQLFNVTEYNIDMLRHEAEYYGIIPLCRQLSLFEDLVSNPTCGGDVFFQSLLEPRKAPETCKVSSSVVKQIVSFDNGLVIAFRNYVECYRLSEHFGWQSVFKTPYTEKEITFVSFHFEFIAGNVCVMLAICEEEKEISLWSARCSPREAITAMFDRTRQFNFNIFDIQEIGRYNLKDCPVDSLIFIGPQLVALSQKKGRVGIRNSSRRWFVQDLKPLDGVDSSITAFDKADSDYLFLGSNHGIIYLIDMQKFPLRMKDGDLLINEFYKDPENEEISTISCFLCSPSPSGKSIEIAYGTRTGTVRILVHHPETVGQGPQLFQTFKVHLSSIWRIKLYHDYLITVCSKLHVRTWKLARFRSLISTQPGSMAHASFKVYNIGGQVKKEINKSLALVSNSCCQTKDADDILPTFSIDVGPFGTQKEEGEFQVFIEMPQASAKHINILYASNGQKIVSLQSVDGSEIMCVSLFQHDSCARSRRFIITGHSNGCVQIWDLTTALEREPYSHLSTRQFDKTQLIKQIILKAS